MNLNYSRTVQTLNFKLCCCCYHKSYFRTNKLVYTHMLGNTRKLVISTFSACFVISTINILHGVNLTHPYSMKDRSVTINTLTADDQASPVGADELGVSKSATTSSAVLTNEWKTQRCIFQNKTAPWIYLATKDPTTFKFQAGYTVHRTTQLF